MLQRATLTALLTAALVMMPPAAVAQGKRGKPPATGTSTPEVIYTLSGKNYQLRVSNEDGTGAVTLHSSGQPIYARFGPRGSGKIALWEGKSLKMLTYEVTSSGAGTTGVATLHSTTGTQFSVIIDFDFSPTGSHLAWWHPDEQQIYVWDVAAGQVSTQVPTGWPVFDVGFTSDGSRIVYSESTDGGFANLEVKSVPTSGGSPSGLGITGRINGVDTGNADDKLLLKRQIAGVGSYQELVLAGETTGTGSSTATTVR
jgi:WD40 repeat protein